MWFHFTWAESRSDPGSWTWSSRKARVLEPAATGAVAPPCRKRGDVVADVHGLPCYAGLHGRLCHGWSNPEKYPRVQRLGDEVVLSEAEPFIGECFDHALGDPLVRKLGNGARGSHFHGVIDGARPDVQCPAEYERKAQDV